jgi:hypothetical protein
MESVHGRWFPGRRECGCSRSPSGVPFFIRDHSPGEGRRGREASIRRCKMGQSRPLPLTTRRCWGRSHDLSGHREGFGVGVPGSHTWSTVGGWRRRTCGGRSTRRSFFVSFSVAETMCSSMAVADATTTINRRRERANEEEEEEDITGVRS